MSEHPADNDDAAYYRLSKAAAPEAGAAAYLNHPENGWMPVLGVYTDIELDIVVVSLGDAETGAFATQYRTDYPNYEDIIVSDHFAREIVHPGDWEEIAPEPADDIVAELPSETPGKSNLN